ncbi:MAG: LysR family transcriptional regulator [Rhizobiaceae bacterium]
MDTQSLKLFVLAAEKLNISAAGRELGMAPAVASSRLAKLETGLGAELLHRSTRKVALSIEGVDFLPYAREILAQEEAAMAALGHGSATISGTLRFAAPSTFAQLYIAPILPKFLNLYPDINLDLKFSDVQFDLFDGSFDLALRNLAIGDTSLKGRKLADDIRILCASPGYIEQYGAPADPADLPDHQLLAFRDRAAKPMVAADGRTALFAPSEGKCRLIFDDGHSMKLATIAGAGISANSLWSVDREIRQGYLVPILPGFSLDEQIALWLIYPKSNVLTAKVRVFIDFLRAEIGPQLTEMVSAAQQN